MIEINIPGKKKLCLRYLVLDYNGTLAIDGNLIAGVKKALISLTNSLSIHIITADTFGKAKAGLQGINCELVILPEENQDTGKLEYIKKLGKEQTVCIGNGLNDRLMILEAALGITLIQQEGAAGLTVMAADIVCLDIKAALQLFTNPNRMKATLRI